MDSLRGQLLLASPGLSDPNFRQTVILVTEHTADGAMGLVLNRPSSETVDELVPELGSLGGLVHSGGPVETGGVVALGELEEPEEAIALVFADIGFLALGEEHATRRTRVFAGYAGWAGGQLEAELAEGSWIVEPASPDEVFSDEPETLWNTILRSKGGRYALFATMPLDPSLN